LQTERQREPQIIEALHTRSLDRSPDQHPALLNLQNYHALWSRVLAQVFVNAMELADITSIAPPPLVLTVLDQCVYYYPTNLFPHLLDFMLAGGEDWAQKMIVIKEQFALRQTIFDVLEETAGHASL
jgi:hypothetical protein